MDIIDHIAIRVSDLQESEEWYLSHLKAEITFRDRKYIRLKVGNTNIALIDEAHYPWAHIGIIVENKNDLLVLKDFIKKYEINIPPIIKKIRKSFIHNDGNKNNIVLDARGQIKGIIDFGDMVRSFTVCEPAVCVSYLIQNSKMHSNDITQFLDGYSSVYDLNDYELRSLPYLVCIRLCISVTMAAWRKKLFPKNKYLTISERPAWSLIHSLKKTDLENWF